MDSDKLVSSQSTDSWQELFATADMGETVSHHVISRGGKPFLFLPAANSAASRALDIYAAQTPKARLAKVILRGCLAVGLRPGLIKSSIVVGETDPFAAFLRASSGVEPGERFSFAVLAGNPRAPGRRHVFLLFDSAARPVTVVKVGITPKARELIAHESGMLASFGTTQTGLPKLRGVFSADGWSAFAMDFIRGDSPGEHSNSALGKIFTSWVKEKSSIAVEAIPAWQRLLANQDGGGLPKPIANLATYQVRPVLFHGDFAPWNVKVADGKWTVLDWERGESVGIPLWDWLHFVIQPNVLVRRETTDATMERLKTLFASPEFIRYAKQCDVSGAEWKLTFAYVDYSVRVIRQVQGLALLEKLREALRARIITS
jgi:hypothetical protein